MPGQPRVRGVRDGAWLCATVRAPLCAATDCVAPPLHLTRTASPSVRTGTRTSVPPPVRERLLGRQPYLSARGLAQQRVTGRGDRGEPRRGREGTGRGGAAHQQHHWYEGAAERRPAHHVAHRVGHGAQGRGGACGGRGGTRCDGSGTRGVRGRGHGVFNAARQSRSLAAREVSASRTRVRGVTRHCAGAFAQACSGVNAPPVTATPAWARGECSRTLWVWDLGRRFPVVIRAGTS